MKVLLVNPKQHNEKVFYINLGLATIGAIVQKAGHSVQTLDLDAMKYQNRKIELIPKADVVLVSGMVTNVKNICAAVETVKAALPNAKYVLGGGCATVAPMVLQEYLVRWFDFFVIGEGDDIIIPLLKKIEGGGSECIPNVRKMTDSSDQQDSLSPPSLADVPRPAYELFDVDSYVDFLKKTGRSFEIYSSKGCPMKCTFCYRISGSTVRFRNVDHVLAEMDFIFDRYGFNKFSFEDDTFGFDRQWLTEFCGKIKKRGYRFRFQAFINSLWDVRKLDLMKDSGLFGISMGVESGSPRILKILKKNNNLKIAERVVEYCNKNEISVSGTFIIGTPGENWESIEETKNFLIRNYFDTFQLIFLSPYPGTSLFEWAMEKGVIRDIMHHILNFKYSNEVYVNLTEYSDQELHDMCDYILDSVAKAQGRKRLSPITWIEDGIRAASSE